VRSLGEVGDGGRLAGFLAIWPQKRLSRTPRAFQCVARQISGAAKVEVTIDCHGGLPAGVRWLVAPHAAS
jgi:hypothetical protein